MKINKVKNAQMFRWLWRINGGLIFLVGVGICGILAFAAFSAIKDKFKTNNRDTVRVTTPTGAIVRHQLSYGTFGKVIGTNYLMSPLRSEQEYTNFGYASMKEQNNTAVRNYFFFNISDQSNRWLLPHNEFLFVSSEKIPLENKIVKSEENDLPITAILYEVIKADFNGDGKMNGNDKRTIACSDATGASFVEIIANVDEILGKERISDYILLIFYKTDGLNLVAQFHTSERKLIGIKELPQVQ